MQVTVILGSNAGDKRQLFSRAISILAGQGNRVLRKSSLYETEPWGFESQELFLNQAVIFETSLVPGEFLQLCLDTEQKLGRTRTPGVRYSSRTIDIDLLFWDSEIIDTPELTIPHPRIAERNFVLTPLREIMPGFIHPVLKKNISELAGECPDNLSVRQLPD